LHANSAICKKLADALTCPGAEELCSLQINPHKKEPPNKATPIIYENIAPPSKPIPNMYSDVRDKRSDGFETILVPREREQLHGSTILRDPHLSPSATDNNNNNNNSLIVEDEERSSSGVETIIATEESSSFNATAVADDHAADDRAAAPKRKTTNKFYIVGSLGFAAGVLGIVLYGGYSIHSSKQQVVAALNNVAEEVKGYEFEGNGVCQNGTGIFYDYIGFFLVSSPQDCGKRCLACPGQGQAGTVFRGFSFRVGGCFCNVDDGADEDKLKGACPDFGVFFVGNGGIGEIRGVDSDTDYVCYKRKGGKSKSSKRGKANNNKAGGM